MKPTTTLASTVTPDGATIELQEHDGQFYLRINGRALMSTTANASEQEMAVLACAGLSERKNDPARILIGGLGFGFSLRRVLELVGPDASVEVVELLPEIAEWNRTFLARVNGALLEDARVRLIHGDVYDAFKNAGSGPRYDAILLDVDNSPDPLVQNRNGRIYSYSGLGMIKAALAPGGRVVFWSGNSDRGFESELRQVFAQSESVPVRAYPKAKRFAHTLFVAYRN